MPLSLSVQFSIIIYAIICGLLFGMLFDFYRIIRGTKLLPIIIIIEDILFFVLCAIIIFCVLLYSGYAYFGMYVYVFMILSQIVYFIFISSKVYNILKKMICCFTKTFRIAINNITYPFRIIIAKYINKKTR